MTDPTRAVDLDNTGLPSINAQMGSLQSMLDSEYARLKDTWALLLAEKERLDGIKDRIQSYCVGELERLKLNVGGQRFEIRATSVQKNTYFRTLLSGTFTPADADGFYFIDRDPAFMTQVLNYLRSEDVDFDGLSDKQLSRLRAEAEFYMVQDLVAAVDRHRVARGAGGAANAAVAVNMTCQTPGLFNGIFFEISVTKPDAKLIGLSFIAGEARKVIGEAFLKEGPIDTPAMPRKIGEVEQFADAGQPVLIGFSGIPLTAPTYTIGVYSSSSPSAIATCPRAYSDREFAERGFVVTKTYHTTNSRGHFTKRAGEDEFDFMGELLVTK